VDSQHRIFVGIRNVNICPTKHLNGDGLARARVALFVAANDITVGSSGEACLESLYEWVAVVVDGVEASVTSAKGDLVSAIVPPVVHPCPRSHHSEPHHVVDLPPSMFAYPSTPTGQVRVDGDVVDDLVRAWGSNPIIPTRLPIVAGHDPVPPIGVCESEGDCLLVIPAVPEGENVLSSPMPSLIVVIVKEYEGVGVGMHFPIGTPVYQPLGHIPPSEDPGQVDSISKLGYSAQGVIFGAYNCLVVGSLDDFLEEVEAGARCEAVSSVEVI